MQTDTPRMSTSAPKPRNAVQRTADILKRLPDQEEISALQAIADFDADLAARIKGEVLSFSGLRHYDDRSIQKILAEVPEITLCVALRGLSSKAQDFFLHNLPRRVAQNVRDELKTHPPMKQEEVFAARREMADAAQALVERGEIPRPDPDGHVTPDIYL